jgi:hypothetical protein
MPMNKKHYSKYWQWISQEIRNAAGQRCELCFAPNGEWVVRARDGVHPWRPVITTDDDETSIKIVLTVHHVDGNKNNNTRHNLLALCQRCHLRLDLGKHIKNRKSRRTQERVAGSVPFL